MIYIDLHSKGKQVLRIIQLYLHSNKSQIKERCILQQTILTIIKQALSKHYHVIIMSDFNVNPMYRQVTSYNKKKLEFILNLESLDFYDNTKLTHYIIPTSFYNT